MVRRIIVMAVCSIALGAAAPAPAHAQFGKLKDKFKQKVDEKVDKKVDCVLGEVFKDGKCVKSSEAGSGAGGAGAKASGESAKSAALKPGQGVWANFDFVPGARPLFVEDFTRDRVGNFPKRLELLYGNMEVVEWNGARWLRVPKGSLGVGAFKINLPEVLPRRWTMEFDVTLPWNRIGVFTDAEIQTSGHQTGECSPSYSSAWLVLSGTSMGVCKGDGTSGGSTVDPRTLFPDLFENNTYLAEPTRVRVEADGNYVKMYLRDRRVANMPNARVKATKTIIVNVDGVPDDDILITNISINAGGKQMYDALASDGRLALQGIYFDTGSDRIRPESSGTLAEIAEMMKEHADLNLTIEGHTDNVGDAAANQKLSEARAAAVVAALTAAPYNIGANRLSSTGLGSSKPAQPNETPEGRQANRRVELVVKK